MEPPPAPMVMRSIIGVITAWPATKVSRGFMMRNWPPGMVLMSAEVPPMSMVMTLGVSASFDSDRPPITPPAGPLIRILIGFLEQPSMVEMPPFDWMTRTLAGKPASRSLPSRLRR